VASVTGMMDGPGSISRGVDEDGIWENGDDNAPAELGDGDGKGVENGNDGDGEDEWAARVRPPCRRMKRLRSCMDGYGGDAACANASKEEKSLGKINSTVKVACGTWNLSQNQDVTIIN